MKNLYLFILLIIPFFIKGQITLTENDLPKVGDVISSADCEIPVGFSIGSPGANQIYDFSMLVPVDTFSTNIISPDGTVGIDEFPNANLAGEFGGDLVYYKKTNSELLLLGLYVDTSENGIGQYFATHFNPPSKEFEIPSTYNTTYTDISGWTASFPDESIGVDSFRTRFTIMDTVLFDGYGTVILPNGSYEALRERRISKTITEFDTYFLGTWTNVYSFTNTDTTYNWYGKNNPSLASVTTFEGEIFSISYSIIGEQVLTPVADFTSNDLGNGTFEFNDNSTNIPTSWLWNFDDGNTSTQQNPQHTFTTSGAYNVCLTATNSAGSDMRCKVIDVIITSTSDLSNSEVANIFPNPVNQVLFIQLKDKDQKFMDFQLMNTASQIVLEKQLNKNGKYAINVDHLTKGMYFYILKDNTGTIRKKGRLMKI